MHSLRFSLYTIILGTLFGSSDCYDVFEHIPKSLDVKQGRSAILRCKLKSQYLGSYKLSWIMDGEDAVNSRRTMGVEGQLKISQVDKNQDAGNFQCVATSISNSLDKVFSDVINLNIKWFHIENVVRLTPDTSQEIIPGKRVVLNCTLSGKPRPQLRDIVWRRDSTVLPKNGSFNFRATKLIIFELTLNDFDGNYSCCYRTKCSQTNYTLKVRDKKTPVLIQAPEDKIVALNGLAIFKCIFRPVPPNQKIRWYHEDHLITKQKQIESRKVRDDGNGTLTIRGVKEKHEGKYSCKVTGNYKVPAIGTATLRIAYIRMKDNTTQEELLDPGQGHEQLCGPVDAEPDVSITWYKDGKPIREDQDSPTGLTVSGNTLVIMSAQQSDEGEYRCIASNVAGRVSMIYNFRIKRKPKLMSSLISRTEKEGRDVTLNCQADGVPDPAYTWYWNEVPVSGDSDHFQIRDGWLDIKKVVPEDSGIYKCVAKNEMGEDRSSAKIEVEERLKIVEPLSPYVCVEVNKTTSIVCIARGAGNVQVKWEIESRFQAYRVIDTSPSNKTLKILANPKSGDHWKAKCVARGSSEYDVESAVAPVTVSVGKKPKIYKPPLGAAVFEGRPVRFDCGIYPNIELEKLYWTIRNNNSTLKQFTIKDNSDSFKYTIMNNGSLYIKNTSIEDSGAYTCHYNACGFYINKSAELTVAELSQRPSSDSDDPENNSDGSTPRYQNVQTIALAVGGAIAYLGISIVIIVYCRRKRHYKMGKTVNAGEDEAIMMNGTCHRLNTAPVTHLPEKISALEYDPSKLEYIAEIGRGNFGEVLLSKAPGLIPDVGDDVLVMVKKLTPNKIDDPHPSSEQETPPSKTSARLEFNREVNLLFSANHENISRLLGVCNEHSSSITTPDCLITEYLEWGILKLCLHASHEGKIHRFSKHSKMKMCCQIAAALEHLNSLGLCHLDVATRNCLISSKHIVKLSILSLSKDGFEKEYYNHNGQLRPIRWMPPEILLRDEIHVKSDVWSYGVTCWEIFSLGKTPYSDLSDEEFVQEMESAAPPTLPTIDGSKRIASLITKCCQQDPTNRPEFYQIVKKLQSVISGDARSKTSEENTVDVHRPLLPHNDENNHKEGAISTTVS